MPQVRKPEIDRRIRAAAKQRFATDGYPGTSMASIASTAGVATANLYRYYPDGKHELFTAVVPDALVQRLTALIDRRVGALLEPIGQTPADSPEAAELLDLWVEHRLEVAILLGRDDGTPYEGYHQRFVDRLVELAADRYDHIGEVDRQVLGILFDNTRRVLVDILLGFEDEPDLRHAIASFWSYQLPGLDGLRQRIQAHGRP